MLSNEEEECEVLGVWMGEEIKPGVTALRCGKFSFPGKCKTGGLEASLDEVSPGLNQEGFSKAKAKPPVK